MGEACGEVCRDVCKLGTPLIQWLTNSFEIDNINKAHTSTRPNTQYSEPQSRDIQEELCDNVPVTLLCSTRRCSSRNRNSSIPYSDWLARKALASHSLARIGHVQTCCTGGLSTFDPPSEPITGLKYVESNRRGSCTYCSPLDSGI